MVHICISCFVLFCFANSCLVCLLVCFFIVCACVPRHLCHEQYSVHLRSSQYYFVRSIEKQERSENEESIGYDRIVFKFVHVIFTCFNKPMRNVASLQSELKWMIFVLVQSCTNVFHVENPDIFFAHAILVSSASCLDVLILFWVHLFFLVSSFEFHMSGRSSNWGGPYSAPADEQAARTWSVRSFQKQELPEQSTVQAACTWSVRSFQKKELQEQSTAAPGSSAAPWLTELTGTDDGPQDSDSGSSDKITETTDQRSNSRPFS